MSGFTIQQVFGANATQDSNTLAINKADLSAATGLTPSADNDGESLLAALLVQAQNLGLTTESRDGTNTITANPAQQVAINDVSTTYVQRLDASGDEVFYQRDSLTVDMDKIPALNPNDY